MTVKVPVSRRTLIGAVGGTTLASLSGCLGERERDGGTEGAAESELEEEEATGGAESEAVDEWEDVDEIRLATDITVWIGVDPDPIDGVENPTLVVFEGREYAITWENRGEFLHNIELRDEDDEVVDDYATPPMDTEGETQTLEFEATPEIAEYVCDPHEMTMRGDVEVVDPA
ncbi:hypothetical protein CHINAEXTREME_04575 [Halobiforma lacisalsi AJ5]|uniref:Blue (type 1) copper domain-containing protein n=1 Tax=Natronobacterium lacisalsi AJ5 TaxID=358396 RepID=A0A1P8LMR4_NATLA|nr:plastocyanin/azurin family copper-binding protein [Halobiforma lacisalsi]APW97087.1 hypothetical protein CHINAEXTREME_04575 [Halobiforma lacisalsi AJ5]